jgi:hypothetical protein
MAIPKSKAVLLRAAFSLAAPPRPKNWALDGVPAPPSIAVDSLHEEAEDEKVHGKAPDKRPTPQAHRQHKLTIKKRFPEGWSPPKKLSRDAMDGLRELHRFDPQTFTTPLLASKFRISPEAVARVLKSKWQPTREQRIRLVQRERRTREERIRWNRLEEIKKQVMVRLAMEKESQRPSREKEPRFSDRKRPKEGNKGADDRRKARGKNSRDKLFFT